MAVLCKDQFNISVQPMFKAASFESMEVCLTAVSVFIRLIVVYRVPPNMKNGIQKGSFLSEFGDLLEKVSIEPGKLLIMGDFNIHMDLPKASESNQFHHLLKSYNLEQHVKEPTHKDGHILDLIISRPSDNLLSSCNVDSLITDHHAIHTDLQCSKPHPPKRPLLAENQIALMLMICNVIFWNQTFLRNPLQIYVTEFNSMILSLELSSTNMPLKFLKGLWPGIAVPG